MTCTFHVSTSKHACPNSRKKNKPFLRVWKNYRKGFAKSKKIFLIFFFYDRPHFKQPCIYKGQTRKHAKFMM